MRRRDLLLSLMAGTAGALLAPRRALADGFSWTYATDSTPRQHSDSPPPWGKPTDLMCRCWPLSMVGPGDVFVAAESGPSAHARGPDVGVD